MQSLFKFSKQINELVKNEQYEEALKYFNENKIYFSKQEIRSNDFIISNVLKSLRKTNNLNTGLKFLKFYGIEINDETKERVLNSYGWLLWSIAKSINKNSFNKIESQVIDFETNEDDKVKSISKYRNKLNEIILRIQEIIPILHKRNSIYSKNLISSLFLVVINNEKRKKIPDWNFINNFCDKFDPDKLTAKSDKIKIIKNGKEREIELASVKEDWFVFKTKALLNLGKWEECIEYSKKALNSIEKFHYLNDIWFTRRIALSLWKIGEVKEAINKLENITKNVDKWFIYKDLADIYFEINDLKNSFKYAINSLYSLKDKELNAELIFLLGRILKKQGEKDLAFKHFILSKIIREKRGWKIPEKLITELNLFKNNNRENINFKELESELKIYWDDILKDLKFKNKISSKDNIEIRKGVVVEILNETEKGKEILIKSNNKNFIMFLSNNYHLTPKINLYTKVEFRVIYLNNGKKEKKRLKINKIID